MYRRIVKLTLVGYLGLLIYAGWMPLEFDAAEAQAELRRVLVDWPIGLPDILHTWNMQLNILLFLPVGLLVAAAKTRQWRHLGVVAAAVALGVAVSVTIETGQLFEPNRYARLHDVITNAAGALAGAIIGLGLLCAPMRRVWARLARRVQGRHQWIAAAAIVAAMLAGVAWQMHFSLSLARNQWAALLWRPRDGLAIWPWHVWLVRWMAAYGALALVLAAGRAGRREDGPRAIRAAAVAMGVAVVIQGLHLLTPEMPPNLVAVALAGVAASAAAVVAPRLRERRIELPVMVLACAAATGAMIAYVGWLSSGGETSLPLWGLYRREFAWGYYAVARRWAIMGSLSFLLAFYLSLTRNRRLAWRMGVAAAGAAGCAAGLEVVRLTVVGRINVAGLIEHTLAAAAGTLAFALLWRILDRRVSAAPWSPYQGVDRRGPAARAGSAQRIAPTVADSPDRPAGDVAPDPAAHAPGRDSSRSRGVIRP